MFPVIVCHLFSMRTQTAISALFASAFALSAYLLGTLSTVEEGRVCNQ